MLKLMLKFITVYSPSLGEVRAGAQGRNPEAETKAKAMEEQAYSVSFLLTSRTTCPRMVPPLVGWALPH